MKARSMSWKPSRTLLNFVIDSLGLLLMLSMLCTGVIIRFVLPPGSSGRNGGRGFSLWGMERHAWGDLHFWLAVSLVGLLLLHVALHWSWVCGLWKRWRCSDGGAPRVAPVLSGVAFLLGLVLPVDHLKSSLNLPVGTSEHERLGRLGRRFGFQIDQVRRAIATYRKL
jgi:hypothetical protein